MPKTASYTKKAIDDYRKKHDIIYLTVDKGIKDRLQAAGLNNTEIVKIILAELEEREKTP